MTNRKKLAKLNKSDDIKKIVEKILEDPYKYASSVSILELVKILEELSYNYYHVGESLVSDTIFDLLKSTLEERDPTNEFLSKVGAPISKEFVNLPYPMSSLEKIKPDTELLEKWKKKYKGPYVLSDKLDGISGLLFKDKNTSKLYTRGDITTGQDISFLIPYVIGNKFDLKKIPNGTAIRGELIMSKQNFEKIKDKYKNARNTIAGLVNSKHFSNEIAKLTDFIGYSIIYPKLTSINQFNQLKEWGFPYVNYKTEKNIDNTLLSEYLQDRRKNGNYEVDGIVVSDSSNIYDVGDKNPEHSFAFKMVLTDQVAEATVLDLEWNITKYGYIKPIVKIEPVNLVGVTIKNATAFNAKFVVDNVLGPGSVIKIVRSGDVIPHILEVLKPSATGKPKMPKIPYEWNKTNIDIIAKDVSGDTKNAIAIKQITDFFRVMGVKNISEGIVTKLVENGYDTIEKVLKADLDDLAKINGMGDKIVTKIYDNIQTSFKISKLETLMAASNTFGRGLGTRKLKIVVNAYPNIMKEKWDKTTLKNKIMLLDGFDDITASQFTNNFDKFKKFYNKLENIDTIDISHLNKKTPTISNTSNKSTDNLFTGQKIVFTGVRDKDMESFIENNGGTISSSVSKNTTLLIYSENEKDNSAKYNKAKELKIEMILYDDFKKKYMK